MLLNSKSYRIYPFLLLQHGLLSFFMLVFLNCRVNADLSQIDCPSRTAICPKDPYLKSENEFCEINYGRNAEFLSKCGPAQSKPLCSLNACEGKNYNSNPTPFNTEKTCLAAQIIKKGYDQSPNGIWELNAQTQLEKLLKSKVTLGSSSAGGVLYFHFVDEEWQWLVFLGSKTLKNWITDLEYDLVYVPKLDMPLHNGFFQAAQSLYKNLETQINQHSNKKIRLIGHSLGGATATILSLILTVENYSIDTLITFGQPQITNANGAITFNSDFSSQIPIVRIINENDHVAFALDILNQNYTHVGPEVWLQNTDEMAKNASKMTFAILPLPDNTQKLSWEEGLSELTDHQEAAYIESLNQLFCQI